MVDWDWVTPQMNFYIFSCKFKIRKFHDKEERGSSLSVHSEMRKFHLRLTLPKCRNYDEIKGVLAFLVKFTQRSRLLKRICNKWRIIRITRLFRVNLSSEICVSITLYCIHFIIEIPPRLLTKTFGASLQSIKDFLNFLSSTNILQ